MKIHESLIPLALALTGCATYSARISHHELIVQTGSVPGSATTEGGRALPLAVVMNDMEIVDSTYVERFGYVRVEPIYESKSYLLGPGANAIIHVDSAYRGKVIIRGTDGEHLRTVTNRSKLDVMAERSWMEIDPRDCE